MFTRVARGMACARMERVRADGGNMRSRGGGARKQRAREDETQEKRAHAVVRSVGECLPAENRACDARGGAHATPAAETPERWVEMPKRLPVRVGRVLQA